VIVASWFKVDTIGRKISEVVIYIGRPALSNQVKKYGREDTLPKSMNLPAAERRGASPTVNKTNLLALITGFQVIRLGGFIMRGRAIRGFRGRGVMRHLG
jgi:hypothetical protein